MGPGMISDRVSRGRDPPGQLWMFGSWLADQKEGRVHAFPRQGGQYLRRRRRPWAIIEGQHHLVVPERQGLWKILQPHARVGGRVAANDTRRAKRPLARTVRRPGR